MIWRSCALAALALLAGGTASAQEAAPFAPVVLQHELKLEKRTLAYASEAGLMPIRSADGETLIADMSYVAYTAVAKGGKTRPVAFIWNGGSGANSTPLHYGAFGPMRLADGAMKPNEATLLDVADIVFIDQIETGFGRYAPGISRQPYVNQQQDARAFGTFIESYLRAHGGPERPALLIGESYGVRRAQLVAEDLLTRGIEPEALVLISGYILVGKRLEPVAEGAFRLPGYAALAFTRGESKQLHSDVEAHDAALAWARGVLSKTKADDTSAEIDFGEGLKRFFGYTDDDMAASGFQLSPMATPKALAKLAQGHATLIFRDIWSPISYDMRNWKSDNREWISQAIIDDLREDLGFNPKGRSYVGQERDMARVRAPLAAMTQPMKITRADGTVVELTPETLDQFPELKGAMDLLTNSSGGQAKRPDDGLADTIVNFDVHFGASLSLPSSPMPALMDKAPEMELFVIGGMYDDLVPCAVGAEMARRDLPDDAARVRTKCYPGGHMMYDDETVSRQLSNDVRGFIRDVQAGGPLTP